MSAGNNHSVRWWDGYKYNGMQIRFKMNDEIDIQKWGDNGEHVEGIEEYEERLIKKLSDINAAPDGTADNSSAHSEEEARGQNQDGDFERTDGTRKSDNRLSREEIEQVLESSRKGTQAKTVHMGSGTLCIHMGSGTLCIAKMVPKV